MELFVTMCDDDVTNMIGKVFPTMIPEMTESSKHQLMAFVGFGLVDRVLVLGLLLVIK